MSLGWILAYTETGNGKDLVCLYKEENVVCNLLNPLKDDHCV